jgi:hypothetical protein
LYRETFLSELKIRNIKPGFRTVLSGSWERKG